MSLGVASYVLVKPKRLAPFMPPAFGRAFSHADAFEKNEEEIMKAGKESAKSKGGRPGKVVKRDKLLGVKCTTVEAFLIKAKAEKIPLTVSEYLRELGLTGKIDMRKKALPKEVLQLTGTLNHLAANLNQIAHKRNRGEELNAIERATLMVLSGEVKELAKAFKAALK